MVDVNEGTIDTMDPMEIVQSKADSKDIAEFFFDSANAISDYVGKKDKKKADGVKEKAKETQAILNDLKEKDDDKDKDSKWDTAKDATTKTLSSIQGAIKKFDSGDTGEIISGVFDILGSLSEFASLAGPKGQLIAAIVGPFCSIISSLFGAKPEPKESQEALIHRVVTEALNVQTADDLKSSAAGVQKEMVEKMKYVKSFFNEADEMGVRDRYFITDDSYVSAGSEFIGKLKYYIEKDLKTGDEDTAHRNAVFISTYCTLVYIRCQHLLMLSALYASDEESKLVSKATKNAADDQRSACIKMLDKLYSAENRNTLTWNKVGSLPASQLDIIRGFYGKPMPGVWHQVSGGATQIAASADGQHIWNTNSKGLTWYSTDNGKSWVIVPNHLMMKYLSVSSGSNWVWGCDGSTWDYGVPDASGIYYRQGRNGTWIKAPGVAGRAVHVSGCGQYVVILAEGGIWYCHCPNGPDKGMEWRKMTTTYRKKRSNSRVVGSEEPATPHSHQISLENDEEEQAMTKDLIKTDDVEEQAMQSKFAYVNTTAPPDFTENVDGKFQSVSVSSGGRHIWATTKDGTVLYKSKFNNDDWEWKHGQYMQVCVSPNGNKIFGIGGGGAGNGRLWCRNLADAHDFHFSKGDKLDNTIKYIAVTNDKVWVVTNDKKMYYQGY